MIVFDNEGARFNYRVAAVMLHGQRVLLHRFETEEFWCLPGGRVEMLEPAAVSLRREMREELGEDVAVQRLLWVAENFFKHEGLSYHELGFYFLASLREHSELPARQSWVGYEGDGSKLHFQWYDPSGLESLPLLPAFLRTALRSIPATTEHIVHRE